MGKVERWIVVISDGPAVAVECGRVRSGSNVEFISDFRFGFRTVQFENNLIWSGLVRSGQVRSDDDRANLFPMAVHSVIF